MNIEKIAAIALILAGLWVAFGIVCHPAAWLAGAGTAGVGILTLVIPGKKISPAKEELDT